MPEVSRLARVPQHHPWNETIPKKKRKLISLTHCSSFSNGHNNNNVSLTMSYATSSPAATTGGQGNTPVSTCPVHSVHALVDVISGGWVSAAGLGAGWLPDPLFPSFCTSRCAIPYRAQPVQISPDLINCLFPPYRPLSYQYPLALLRNSPHFSYSVLLLVSCRHGLDND